MFKLLKFWVVFKTIRGLWKTKPKPKPRQSIGPE